MIFFLSRRCSNIAATILNSEFLVAGTKLEIAMKRIQNLMNNVETNVKLLEYNRIFNALELIRSQYQMLKAVTWRYTHPRSSSAWCLLWRIQEFYEILKLGTVYFLFLFI